MMGKRALAANSSSRRICSELFDSAEKINTMALLPWIARVIWPANGRPGCTSRGAIQQRIAALSRAAQRGSATDLFFVEYEIKTSCAMQFQMGFTRVLQESRHDVTRKFLVRRIENCNGEMQA